MLNGLLIDTEYCSGCHSCELACRNQNGLKLDQYGIKVCEVGPFVVDEAADKYIWNYEPVVTELCNTCVERRVNGEKAACELHCLADAIVVGAVDDLMTLAKEKGKHVNILIP